MKRKGFTLIELITVIILLGLIGLLVYPVFENMIQNNKQKLYDEQISSLERYAVTWITANNDTIPKDGTTYKLSFDRMIRDGYIKNDDIINPLDGENLPGCINIKWESNINQYKHNYDADCVV